MSDDSCYDKAMKKLNESSNIKLEEMRRRQSNPNSGIDDTCLGPIVLRECNAYHAASY